MLGERFPPLGALLKEAALPVPVPPVRVVERSGPTWAWERHTRARDGWQRRVEAAAVQRKEARKVTLPSITDAPGRWITRGACAGHPDPDLWFPNGAGIPSRVRRALGVCAGCPVRVPCAEYAVTHQVAGIWGGLTETDRDTPAAASRVERRGA